MAGQDEFEKLFALQSRFPGKFHLLKRLTDFDSRRLMEFRDTRTFQNQQPGTADYVRRALEAGGEVVVAPSGATQIMVMVKAGSQRRSASRAEPPSEDFKDHSATWMLLGGGAAALVVIFMLLRG